MGGAQGQGGEHVEGGATLFDDQLLLSDLRTNLQAEARALRLCRRGLCRFVRIARTQGVRGTSARYLKDLRHVRDLAELALQLLHHYGPLHSTVTDRCPCAPPAEAERG